MNAEQLTKFHEGKRNTLYKDSSGVPTIGYGTNISSIDDTEAEFLFDHRFDRVRQHAKQALPFFGAMDEVRQAVVLDMLYNIGLTGFMQFKNTIAAMRIGDYQGAANGMLASLWATQVGKRATRLAQMMRTGEWPSDVP